MSVTLIGYPVSPFVRKARVALEHHEIQYKLDPIVPYTQRAEVLKFNPAGTVPVLVGAAASPITESADIVEWADQQSTGSALISKDPEIRRRALQVQHFADTQLAQVFGGMMFGQRIVVPHYFNKATGREDVVRQAMQDLAPQALDAVSDIVGDEAYAAGAFSVADIAMSTWLRAAKLAGFQLDNERWPNVADWLTRCFNQPGYASVIASEESLDVVKWARETYGGNA